MAVASEVMFEVKTCKINILRLLGHIFYHFSPNQRNEEEFGIFPHCDKDDIGNGLLYWSNFCCRKNYCLDIYS